MGPTGERQNEDISRSLLRGRVSEHDALRPSFKRLASQTLGPESSKRAQLSHDEGDGDWDEDDGDSSPNSYTRIGSDHPAAILDRRRRMSAPATGPPLALVEESRVE
jgi:hypothetical protein